MNTLITLIALISFGVSLILFFQLRKVIVESNANVQQRTLDLTLQKQKLEEQLIEQKEIEDALRNQNEYFFALHETTLTLLKRLDLNDLLTEIVRKAALLIGTQHGYLYVIEPKSNLMVMQAGVGIFEAEIGRSVKRGEGLTGHAWELGMPLSVSNYRAWSGNLSGPDTLYAVITIPLQIETEILGFIGLAHTEEGLEFTLEEQAVLERFGALASVALENARLYNIVQHELKKRQLVETSLRHNEEQLRLALNASHVATWQLHLPTNDMTWSDNIETLLGLPPGTFDGTTESFQKLIHPDDLEKFKASKKASLDEGLLYNVEYRIIWPDKSTRWLVGQGQVFRDAIGQPIQMMGTLLDITESKRTSEEIDRWFNLSVDMVAIADKEGYFRRTNRSFQDVLGYSQAQLLIRPFREFIHPDDVPATLVEIKKTLQGTPTTQFENRCLCADGSYKWLSWTAQATSDGHFYTIARDMTEYKKAEELLRQSKRRLSLLIQQSPIAIIEWDLSFKVREWSLAAEKIFAYSREEAFGRHASFIVPQEARLYVDGVFEQLMAQTGGTNSVNENLTANEELITCQWYNAPLIDDDGSVLGVVSLVELLEDDLH